MEFKSLAQAKRETGLSYLGSVNNGAKHAKAYKYKEMVYTIYLAPANISGYEVCPGRSAECTKACLNESGRNRLNKNLNTINKSRIKKTRLFFEEKEFFMGWLIHEINAARRKAEFNGYKFSIRLNNTSDISPEEFYVVKNGIKTNILELYPDIQFYDY